MSDMNTVKQKYHMLLDVMDERTRRLWAASEAFALGRSGPSLVAEATGLSRATICRGMREFERLGMIPMLPSRARLAEPGPCQALSGDRVRRPGGGRKKAELKDPAIEAVLEKLLTDQVGGDPMNERKWVRCSLRQLSTWLNEEGHPAGSHTVKRLLKKMGYSLKANERKQGQSSPTCPERDEQFQYIAAQKAKFSAAGWPMISVDTKKKELIGNFRRSGKEWCKEAAKVDEHDFPGAAECRAVPFGVYDLVRNKASVYVGISNNTPEFAVVSIANWWEQEGQVAYPRADRLLILSDGGGSNGCRARAWKCNLQSLVSNRFSLTLIVCHFPTGCSKWNPVEHRVFSYISKNWAAKPLRTLGTMLGYIRGTRTKTGLEIKAYLDEGFYKNSVKYSHKDVDQLCLEANAVCPQRNYTISPQASPLP